MYIPDELAICPRQLVCGSVLTSALVVLLFFKFSRRTGSLAPFLFRFGNILATPEYCFVRGHGCIGLTGERRRTAMNFPVGNMRNQSGPLARVPAQSASRPCF